MDRILEYSGKISEIESRPPGEFYVDVPSDQPAYKPVQDLVKLGVFSVGPDRKFIGEARLSRYTFYSYYAIFLEKLENANLPETSGDSDFSDVTPDHPAYVYLQKLVGAGLLAGKTALSGDKLITRNEMAVFTAKVLDYYHPGEIEKPKEIPSSPYLDIPSDNYALPAVEQLVEAGVLRPVPGERFYGGRPINLFYLVDMIAKVVEKIFVPEGEELPLADFSKAYKDVPPSNLAYRSIQKLIALRLIPEGGGRELFYGDRKIMRYQMVFFAFSALENALSDLTSFKMADPSRGYIDVPPTHYVYETIQKLIELGVLDGEETKYFRGEQYVDRYEVSDFMVKLILRITTKIVEEKTPALKRPVEYGFKTILTTGLSAQQIANGKASGEDLVTLSALQTIALTLDRSLKEGVAAFVSLRSAYNFGETAALSSPVLDQSYVTLNSPPFLLQLGRTNVYQGFTPFGNTLFIDTFSDLILLNYDHSWFNLNSAVGKLSYTGDIKQDSNFGLICLSPKLQGLLSWLELSLGGSLITNPMDPLTFTPLVTRIYQAYGGLKINLFNCFEFSAEKAGLNYSDPGVISNLGTASPEDTGAAQYNLTYFSEDYGYTFSIGYQRIGQSYYLGPLADPTNLLGVERGTEAVLFKTKFAPSPDQYVGADFAYITRERLNFRTGLSVYYSLRALEAGYFNLRITKIAENAQTPHDQLSTVASLSLSF